VRRLRACLDSSFPFDALVTVADDASADDTRRIATARAERLPEAQGGTGESIAATPQKKPPDLQAPGHHD
jgi:hypothetical protein